MQVWLDRIQLDGRCQVGAESISVPKEKKRSQSGLACLYSTVQYKDEALMCPHYNHFVHKVVHKVDWAELWGGLESEWFQCDFVDR